MLDTKAANGSSFQTAGAVKLKASQLKLVANLGLRARFTNVDQISVQLN